MNKKNLNTLLMKHILGETSEAERSELFARADKEEMERIMKASDLATRYKIYDSIENPDIHSIYERLSEKEKLNSTRHNHLFVFSKRIMSVAATAILLIVAGVTTYWYSIQPSVTPPEVSEDITPFINMQRQSEPNNSEITKYFEANKTNVTEDQIAPYQLDPATAEEMLRAENISTSYNKEYWLTLDDGTIVHLASGSRIIYPEHFARPTLWDSNPVREVVLDGDAYFMVAHDTKRTFVVHTLHGDVIDYGTEFFVSTEAESTTVALVQGSVGVRPHGFSETKLKPGQESVISGNNIMVSNIDTERYTAWNTGKFAFNNTRLEYVMDVMSKWYGIKVEYANDKVKDVCLSGYFDRYKDVADAIDAIVAVTGLTVVKTDNGTYIYKE